MPRVVPSQVVDLIDKIFPKARTATEQENFVINRENSHAIAGLLEVINQLPSEFITVTGETYMECMVSIAALRTMQNQWIQYDRAFDSVPGLRRLNPVALIRHALAQCQDECPSGETSELQFVSDPEFRQQLRLDITATNSAIMNGEWKAATVLAGSVIESLLLWRLLREDPPAVMEAAAKHFTQKANPNLENWVLFQYVEVAAGLKLITANTAMGCRLAKDYRNLIHPGRAQRLAQTCNRGTAFSAVGAMEHVINDLNVQGGK